MVSHKHNLDICQKATSVDEALYGLREHGKDYKQRFFYLVGCGSVDYSIRGAFIYAPHLGAQFCLPYGRHKAAVAGTDVYEAAAAVSENAQQNPPYLRLLTGNLRAADGSPIHVYGARRALAYLEWYYGYRVCGTIAHAFDENRVPGQIYYAIESGTWTYVPLGQPDTAVSGKNLYTAYETAMSKARQDVSYLREMVRGVPIDVDIAREIFCGRKLDEALEEIKDVPAEYLSDLPDEFLTKHLSNVLKYASRAYLFR